MGPSPCDFQPRHNCGRRTAKEYLERCEKLLERDAGKAHIRTRKHGLRAGALTGSEFVIDFPMEGTIRTRLWLADGRFYSLTLLGNAEAVASADADRFLDSLVHLKSPPIKAKPDPSLSKDKLGEIQKSR